MRGLLWAHHDAPGQICDITLDRGKHVPRCWVYFRYHMGCGHHYKEHNKHLRTPIRKTPQTCGDPCVKPGESADTPAGSHNCQTAALPSFGLITCGDRRFATPPEGDVASVVARSCGETSGIGNLDRFLCSHVTAFWSLSADGSPTTLQSVNAMAKANRFKLAGAPFRIATF